MTARQYINMYSTRSHVNGFYSIPEYEWRGEDAWGRVFRPQCMQPHPSYYPAHHPPYHSYGFSNIQGYPSRPAPGHFRLPTHSAPRTLSYQQFLDLSFPYVPPHIVHLGKRMFPRRPRHNTTRHPPPRGDSEDNPEVLDLARDIYKYVQLDYQSDNWRSLPETLNKKIKLITDNLWPPLVDAPLRAKYEEIGKKFGEDIRRQTMLHLLGQSCLIQDRLKAKHNPEHLKPAMKIAKEWVGRRLKSHDNTEHSLQMVEELVGESFRPPVTPPVPAPSPVRGGSPAPNRPPMVDVPAPTSSPTLPKKRSPAPPPVLCPPLTSAKTHVPLATTQAHLPLTPKRLRSPTSNHHSSRYPSIDIPAPQMDPDIEPDETPPPPVHKKRIVPSIRPDPTKKIQTTLKDSIPITIDSDDEPFLSCRLAIPNFSNCPSSSSSSDD